MQRICEILDPSGRLKLSSGSMLRRHGRAIAIAVAATILLHDGRAMAINAIWSHDAPVLAELAITEWKTYLEISKMLMETRKIVAHGRELVGVTKAAWKAIDDLREMKWSDLKEAGIEGLRRSFPEVEGIYSDAKSMADWRSGPDARSIATFRGMLWQHVYGPSIDYLHDQHENSKVIAESKDQRARWRGIITTLRPDLDALLEECNKGEGACSAAANRAQIKQASLLTDIQEATSKNNELLERQRASADSERAGRYFQYERFLHDFEQHIAVTLGTGDDDERRCRAGRCLYERYAAVPSQVYDQFRERHPPARRDP